MQAASEGDLQQVQTLLAEGADPLCVNQMGIMAINQASNHPTVLKLLIKKHQPIDQLFLENILSELNHYQSDINNKKEDEILLDKLVLLLTGMENITDKQQQQRKTLLAHLQSYGNSESQKDLEGLVGQEFLALHVRHLLQILGDVILKHHDRDFKDWTRDQITSCLKRELLVTVQAFHFGLLSDLANQNNQTDLRPAVVKAILTALSQLSEGEELIYQIGYRQIFLPENITTSSAHGTNQTQSSSYSINAVPKKEEGGCLVM